MSVSREVIGIVCIVLALFLELLSYYKQIAKTVREKHSKHVSSSAYMVKLLKYIVTIIALSIYANWVGVWIEAAALLMCIVAFYLIIKYKPKNWHLINTKWFKL